MTRPPSILFPAALLLAACGGSDGGHEPGGGEGGTGGTGPSCTQAQCRGGADDYWEVEAICLPGGCSDVGLLDEFGDVRRGAMLVGLESRGVDARQISSGYLRIFYPKDTSGRPVDCERVLAAPGRLDDTLNVVGYYTTAIRSGGLRELAASLGPVAGLPVNDASTAYVVHVALFNGDRDPFTHDPTGPMLVEGCQGGMVVADGEAADWSNPDAAHQFSGLVADRIP